MASLRQTSLLSTALAKSGPFDFPSNKFFLDFFARERGFKTRLKNLVGFLSNSLLSVSPQAKIDFSAKPAVWTAIERAVTAII